MENTWSDYSNLIKPRQPQVCERCVLRVRPYVLVLCVEMRILICLRSVCTH